MLELPGYKIEKQIGKGGMARVYLALHEGLDRQVAIKVMNRQLDADDSGFSDRFMREARIVANLGHQNIVTVYDVGNHDGYHYIAMEYLPGGVTLDTKIKDGISIRDGMLTLKQVAAALSYAHGKGIVHRDIKPENVMYREDGTAVLTDFGIARSTTSATKMTATGTVIGTPHYMSPEQAQGHDIGAYSDIYSLGIVFHEILTGELPYDADSTIAIVFKHITEPVPTLEGDLAKYQPILTQMMAKEKENRYASCDELIADLDAMLMGGQLDSKATLVNAGTMINSALVDKIVGRKTIVEKPKADNVIRYAVIALVVIIVGGATGGYFYYQAEADKQALALQKQQKNLLDKKNKQASLEQQKKSDQDKQAQQARDKATNQEQQKLSAEQKQLEQENLAKQREADKKKKDKQRQAKKKKIDDLLRKAETQLLNTELNDAYKTFKRVLKVDSRNRSAKAGITRVADQYLALASNEALKGDFDQANKYIGSVIQISPTHKNLAATQQKIFDIKNQDLARQAEQQRQQKTQQPVVEEKKKRRSFGGF